MNSFAIIVLALSYCVNVTNSARGCAGRAAAAGLVCVCNATYCDDVERERPRVGGFVAYTTSQAGSRFKKTTGEFHAVGSTSQCCPTSLQVEPRARRQAAAGFGGAVTDAAAITWAGLPPPLRTHLIDSYFGATGLEYNMLRVPIGGCDFSTRAYAYNELPEGDLLLANFSLAPEDHRYKIPMIKEIMAAATAPVRIVASTWSPPLWMKTNHQYGGMSRLLPEYYQTYALYHLKFLERYAAEGVPVWAITTTNEPLDGLLGLTNFNTLGWSVKQMGAWIANNLGPTIRNSTFRDVKILAVDDQRFTIPLWFNMVVREHPAALQYVDGVAVHYYGDGVTPAAVLRALSAAHPDKFLLATEACEGSFPWQTNKVELGSWARAASYITDILEDLNNDVVGWIDWNLCLDMRGGPNWANNFVDSPVIVNADKQEFYKQPMFYAMGHFSKFIKRDSTWVQVVETKPLLARSVRHVAFLTPGGTLALVLYNDASARDVSVRCGGRQAVVHLEAQSVTTVEFVCDV